MQIFGETKIYVSAQQLSIVQRAFKEYFTGNSIVLTTDPPKYQYEYIHYGYKVEFIYDPNLD